MTPSGDPSAPPAEHPSRRIIVAIDGPSGVGKSTAARRLAARLDLPMLDTGAGYRALGLEVVERGIDPGDRAVVLALASTVSIELRPSAGGDFEVWLDGRAVGQRIRTPEVSAATSQISVYPEVRRRQVELQRRAANLRGAVVEGRDIGTVVFPETRHKFFLDARPPVRAERRYRELRGQGQAASRQRVLEEIERRDQRDSNRRDSPLTRDDTYHFIDTSELSPDEVVARMERHVRARSG